MTINGSLQNIPIVKRFFGTMPALNHVTCKQGGRNNHIFGILDPTLPIHYITSWGYDDDKWQFTEHPHCEAVFWHCASAGSLWSVSKGAKITTYLESPTPLCLFTMQLLWGYDDDKWQLVYIASPLWSGFFGTVPALNHVTYKQGGRNNHIFGILDPTLPIHYINFVGLRWR